MKRLLLMVTALSIMTVGTTVASQAQQYPSQPITLVVGMAAGGITDIATRTIAAEAKKYLGVELPVVNKPGAMQTVAMSYVISARPDGYTLGATTDAPYARAPHMLSLNFNPMTETRPIIYYGTFPAVILVKPGGPLKTLDDVIAYAKANPGKLTYSTAGVASGPHLGFGGFALEKGFKISMVPFTGDSEALLALLGGQVLTAGMGVGSCISQVKAGKAKVVAVIHGEERLDTFPDAPTLREAGFKELLPPPNLGIFGQKQLPDAIAKSIADVFTKASQSNAFKAYAANNYIYPMKGSTGEELKAYLARSNQLTGDLIRQLGIGKSSKAK